MHLKCMFIINIITDLPKVAISSHCTLKKKKISWTWNLSISHDHDRVHEIVKFIITVYIHFKNLSTEALLLFG